MRLMLRWILTASVLAASLCGCDPDVAPTPTPAQVAARVYVLSPQQMRGYQRGTDNTINPQTLADQDKDPSLAARLVDEGWRDGVLDAYGPPKGNPAGLPFDTVTAQAIIFSSATGAATFFRDERKRIDVPPAKGTIADMAGVPAGSVDEVVAYDAFQPSANPGEARQRAFIALLRKGQVVVEVYAFAGANPVTPSEFVALVTAEQELMQTPPQ
jgi:hypothetical protein